MLSPRIKVRIIQRIYNGVAVILLVILSFYLMRDAFSFRDPTMPNGYSNAPISTTREMPVENLNFNTVLIAKDRKLVVINDQTLHVGDKIDDVEITVKEISENRVILQRPDGKEFSLELVPTMTQQARHSNGSMR